MRSTISIDIGSCKTKIIVGSYQKGTVYIEKAFSFDTNKGSIEDGKLIAADGNADILKKSIVQALTDNKVKSKNTILTIQSTSIIRRELEIPHVKPSDMESMIRYEIEQYLPIDLNEYIIEYKVLEEQKDGKSRIIIAALPKDISEAYMNAVQEMRLNPVALDINSNAVSKLFGAKLHINELPYDLDSTVAFVDLGHSFINLCILSKGMFQFSRLIPTGGNDLTLALSDALQISYEDAEQCKHMEADLSNMQTSLDIGSVSYIIEGVVARWAEEVQRVLQFYKTRNANNDINQIFIYGGTSSLKGIDQALSRMLNIEVKQIKAISSISMQKNSDIRNLELYLNSIGAIVRR